MFENLKVRSAVRAAEATLSAKDKIEKTIAAEVANLQPMLRARLAAERAVAEAEAGIALGELEPGKDTPARKNLAERMEAIDRQGLRLAGLRAKMAALVGPVSESYRTVSDALPEYDQALREAFMPEWERAVAAFSAVLAKRRSLEKFVGVMNLWEPDADSEGSSGGADVAEAERPHRVVAALSSVITEFAGHSRLASQAQMNRAIDPARPPYRPGLVYQLVSPFGSIEAGQLAVEASFWPGILEMLAGDGAPLQWLPCPSTIR